MIFSDIASAASKVVKKEGKGNFDLDKRAEVSGKPVKGQDSGFEIDKRADVSEKKDTYSDSRFNVDKRADVRSESSFENKNEVRDSETEKIEGGSYKELKNVYRGDETKEIHHMPADIASELETGEGPCIAMDKEDHRKTASCGSSREAREYQKQQKEYIANGKFREALQMDIDDIREKFGNKYDKAIDQMLKYVDKLESEGKIKC